MSVHKRFIIRAIVILSMAAIAAPGAAARPYPVGPIVDGQSSHQSSARSVRNPVPGKPAQPNVSLATYSRQDKQMVTPVALSSQPIVRVKAPSSGVPVGAAPIAVAVALALSLLALAASVALSRSRARGQGHATALTH